jgi:hypothetical protein
MTGNDANSASRSGGRRRSRRGRGGANDRAKAQGGGKPNKPAPKSGASQKGGASQKSGVSQKGGGKGNRRNRKRRSKPSYGGTGFWGDPAKLPDIPTDIRMTDDPAAVPRSLGTPPLPGHEQIAVHYFTAVYDRSVNTAGALAAAGGLIDPNALVEEDED